MNRTYAVADLHGRFDLFQKAIAEITARGGGTVVFLGDYVDRGPQSRQIIEALIAGAPVGQAWVNLRGNHEDLMVAACAGRMPMKGWLQNGGGQTLISYGQAYGEAVRPEVVPDDHLFWLNSLPEIHVDMHRVYVHAGVDETLHLHEQTRRVTGWMIYPDGWEHGHGDFHVVHGHHAFPGGPMFYRGRTDLDTQAWAIGRLVVGVFDDNRPGGPIDMIEVLGPTIAELETPPIAACA